MGVQQKWRRKGIGERLVKTALEWAASAQIERVELSVQAINLGGIALYRKLGFVEEGTQVRRIKYGPGNYVDSPIMATWVQPQQ
jgi:L-phenylalanine/L-methionine N-acetyltransferase